MYACARRWQEAVADYQQVLAWYPDDPVAIAGLADVAPPHDELPMVGGDISAYLLVDLTSYSVWGY